MIVLLMTTALATDGGAVRSAAETGLKLTDLADFLPACVAEVPETPTLDLGRGCVAGACAGETYGQITQAWGVPDDCNWNERAKKTYCDWEGAGLRAAFPVSEAQQVMEEGLVSETAWTSNAAHRGAYGLGVGVSASCFLRRHEGSVVGLDVRVEHGWLLLDMLQLNDPRTILRLDEGGLVHRLQLSPRVRRSTERTEVQP